MILSSVSLRCASRIMRIFCTALHYASTPIPSWYTSRIWLLKIGYYKLTREKEFADDWIWIVDHSVQWGAEKCLLILGIRKKDLPKDRGLTYSDVEPIELLPVTKSNGDIVYEQLSQAALKTGVPRAIVADGGSDLKCGINKFIDTHKYTAYIYDIKHMVALCIEKSLSSDESWKSFTEFATKAQRYMRQTDAAHLAPPNQRSKARYMNIDKLVGWALRILDMTENTKQKLSINSIDTKLEWISNFEDDIRAWGRIINIADKIVTNISVNGLYRGVRDDLKIKLANEAHCHKAKEFQTNVLHGVFKYECKAHVGERLLGSSTIIESVFGKYKNIEKEQSSSGFTNLLLALPAMLSDTSSELIKQAMVATKAKQVWGWLKNNIGQSVQAKRKILFSTRT